MEKGRSDQTKRSLFYHLRRLYLDPGWFFSLILIVVFLFVALLVFSRLSSGQSAAPDDYLGRLKTLYEQASRQFSTSGSRDERVRLSYAETLLDHNVSSGTYAVYGYSALLGEKSLGSASAYRFLSLVPAAALAFGAFLSYALFYSNGSRSAEKNAFEARLERGRFRLGGYLCYFLLIGLVCLLFGLLSFFVSYPGMTLARVGDDFVYLSTNLLLLIKMAENLVVSVSLAFIPLAVFRLVTPGKRAFFGMLINLAIAIIHAYLSIVSLDKTGIWLYFPLGGIPLSFKAAFSHFSLVISIGGLAICLLKLAVRMDKRGRVN